MSYAFHDSCYAYSRVSTKMQQELEQALDRQDAWLRDGGSSGFKPTMIYSEIGSARGSDDPCKRPEYRQVWDEAHRDDVPLMVTSASRLSRNLRNITHLMKAKPVRVIILDQGGLVSQDELFRLVEIAEENGRQIAAGASDYSNRRIQQGLRQGCAASTKKAGIASGKVRAHKAHEKRQDLIRFFRSRPDLMELPLRDMLNALNPSSIRTASGNAWTYNSASKVLPGIVREIGELCDMEAEVDSVPYDRRGPAGSHVGDEQESARTAPADARESSPSAPCRKRKQERRGLQHGRTTIEIESPGWEIYPERMHVRPVVALRTCFVGRPSSMLPFGSYHADQEYGEVLWRFSPAAAVTAQEFIFHPTQQLTMEADGSLLVRFIASGHLEMAWHLYMWGDAVEVVAPERLRDMVGRHRRDDFPALP